MKNEMGQDLNVSVIVPCYNREKTIKRCIDSIVRQTFPPYEIIAVDDGSTDRTVAILENMPYESLKIIRQNHKGAQAARNLGIINAKGNYIAFLDSDDEWVAEMLEEEMSYFLNAGEKCAVYSDCYQQIGHTKKIWRLSDCTVDSYTKLLKRPGPMFQSLLVKKEWLFEIGLLDENVPAYQEWDTVILLAKKYELVHLKKPLFIYHLHNGETISKDMVRDISGYAYIVRKNKKEILKMCGIESLNNHYNVLVKKCLAHRNKRMIIFLMEMLGINLKYFLLGNVLGK